MEDGTLKSGTHTDVRDPSSWVRDTTSCEIRDLLDRLADKWSLLVIELLGSGTRRFTELHREIDEISQRMLTLALRHLERDGLVSWTRAHRREIAAARTGYDARRESSAGAPSSLAARPAPSSPESPTVS